MFPPSDAEEEETKTDANNQKKPYLATDGEKVAVPKAKQKKGGTNSKVRKKGDAII